MTALPPAKTFCIEFDTLEMPGNVVATQITIESVVKRDNDSMRVDLCCHPLYRKLYEYCMGNPPHGVEKPKVPA